jgi:multisubunit Na+/H+ antiporter MnhG subunit
MEASSQLNLVDGYDGIPAVVKEDVHSSLPDGQQEKETEETEETEEIATATKKKKVTLAKPKHSSRQASFLLSHMKNAERNLESHRLESEKNLLESRKAIISMEKEKSEEIAAVKKQKIDKYQLRTFRLEVLYTVFMVIGMILTIMLNLGLNRHPYIDINNATANNTTNSTMIAVACEGAACNQGEPRGWFLPAAGLTLITVIYLAIDRFFWCCHKTSNTDWSVAKQVAKDLPVLWLLFCTLCVLIVDFVSMGTTGNPVLIVGELENYFAEYFFLFLYSSLHYIISSFFLPSLTKFFFFLFSSCL